MKSYLFILPVLILLFSFVPSAFSVAPSKSVLQLYQETDVIVLGDILSAESFVDSNNLDQTRYVAQIIQPIKGDLQKDTLEFVGIGSKDATRHLGDEIIFEPNHRVFLLLYKSGDVLYMSPYSKSAQNFDPNSEFILPPLKLSKAGIPSDQIHCKNNLELIIKASSDMPACVSSDTAKSLKNRGWSIDLSQI